MSIVTLDDRGGSMEAVVFPEAFAKYGSLLEVDRLVVMTGRLEKDDETSKLIASEVQQIEAAVSDAQRVMSVQLTVPPHDRETVEGLAELFSRHMGGGRVAVEIELRSEDPPVKIKADLSQTRIQPSESLIEAVEGLCGKGTISWL